MKVKIGNTIYDSENEPIMLIFETDEIRRAVAKHLTQMSERSGVRLYVQAPATIPREEIEAFMKDEKNGFTISLMERVFPPEIGQNYRIQTGQNGRYYPQYYDEEHGWRYYKDEHAIISMEDYNDATLFINVQYGTT